MWTLTLCIAVYGVSATRCPSCRHRIKIESDVCANCEFKHARARTFFSYGTLGTVPEAVSPIGRI